MTWFDGSIDFQLPSQSEEVSVSKSFEAVIIIVLKLEKHNFQQQQQN